MGIDKVVCVVVAHDGIDVLEYQVAECAFSASVGSRVVVNSKDQQGEGFIELTGHFAVVSCFIIQFGASWRGDTIVDGGSNSSNGEGTSAVDAFVLKLVVIVAYYVADLA
jgi:hypothetical protein